MELQLTRQWYSMEQFSVVEESGVRFFFIKSRRCKREVNTKVFFMID